MYKSYFGGSDNDRIILKRIHGIRSELCDTQKEISEITKVVSNCNNNTNITKLETENMIIKGGGIILQNINKVTDTIQKTIDKNQAGVLGGVGVITSVALKPTLDKLINVQEQLTTVIEESKNSAENCQRLVKLINGNAKSTCNELSDVLMILSENTENKIETAYKLLHDKIDFKMHDMIVHITNISANTQVELINNNNRFILNILQAFISKIASPDEIKLLEDIKKENLEDIKSLVHLTIDKFLTKK